MLVVDDGRGPERARDAGHDAADSLFHGAPHVGAEVARAATQPRLFRDHVPGVAGLDLRHADHRRLHRRDVAAHDRLERADHLRRRHHRVDREVRHRAVGAAAAHRHLEHVEGRHHGARADGEATGVQPRPVVEAEHRVGGEAVEEPLLDHHPPASFVLLGGLEDEVHGPVESAALGELAGRAQQHGHVAVVAAGVHGAGNLRAIGRLADLLHRQAVQVGPERDRPRPATAAQRAHDTGAGQAPMHVDAEAREQSRHALRGAVLLERDLGMGMQVVPPRGHLPVQAGQSLDMIPGHAQSLRLPAAGAASEAGFTPPGTAKRSRQMSGGEFTSPPRKTRVGGLGGARRERPPASVGGLK